MTDKHTGLFHSVASRVITGAILALGGAIYAYIAPNNEAAIVAVTALKVAWLAITSVAVVVWRLLTAPVPLWAFMLLGAFCAWLWTRRAKPHATPEICADGRRLIEILGMADGDSVDLNIIAGTLDWSRIKTQTVAAELAERGMLQVSGGYSGPLLSLTFEGKRFALDQNLMGSPALKDKMAETIRRSNWRI